MEKFCQNPYCESPSFKEVPVSVKKPSDQVRALCAPCEEAYIWGVQHGRKTAEYIHRPGADKEQIPPAELDGDLPEAEQVVVISVSGGVADVIFKPKGVAVSIFDYDVQGQEQLGKDPDGQDCCISEWRASKQVIGNRHWPIIRQAINNSK